MLNQLQVQTIKGIKLDFSPPRLLLIPLFGTLTISGMKIIKICNTVLLYSTNFLGKSVKAFNHENVGFDLDSALNITPATA